MLRVNAQLIHFMLNQYTPVKLHRCIDLCLIHMDCKEWDCSVDDQSRPLKNYGNTLSMISQAWVDEFVCGAISVESNASKLCCIFAVVNDEVNNDALLSELIILLQFCFLLLSVSHDNYCNGFAFYYILLISAAAVLLLSTLSL